MNRYLAVAAKLTVLSAALLAAGCGGGGGTVAADPPAATVPAPEAQRSVTGVASKGTIKKARVLAYSLDAQGNKSAAPISTTSTADDGSFTAKIPASVLTFVIEIDAATGATMADEATGQDIPFPADMKLRSVVRLADSAEAAVTSHVSPLTELVVKTAESAPGGLTAANIAQSKTGIAAALGFDPEKVKPVNSNTTAAATASQEERIQSLTLAAISKLAQDGKLGCTAAEASARIACVVKEVAKSGTISADKLTLGETVRGEVRQALTTVASNPTINQTGVSSVAGLASFAQSVVPTQAGTPTGIESTKKMFAALRTNVNAWADSTRADGKLTAQADAVKADFETAIAPLDSDMLSWIKLSTRAIDHFTSYKAGTTTNAIMSTHIFNGADGSCAVVNDVGITATSAANATSITCSTSRMGAFTYVPATPTAAAKYSFVRVGTGIILTPVAGQQTAFSYKARSYVQTVTQGNEGAMTTSPPAPIGIYGSAAEDRATGTIAYTKSGADLSSVTIAGMMPARFSDDGVAITDNQLWNLTAVRSALGGNLFNYTIAGDFTAYKAGVAAGKLAVNAGSFARVQEDGNGNVAVDGVKELKLSIAGAAGSSKIVGTVDIANFMGDKNGVNAIPTKVAFTGSVSKGESEFFSGTLSVEQAGYGQFDTSLPLSSTNLIKLTVSLTGTLTVPARPPLMLSASVANDSLDGHKETLQYNDGAVVINASREVKGAAPALISIASADGVSFKLDGGERVFVMKDDAKVADLNVKTGVVTYVDGSFESLK
jgi:hypothetical protein